MSWLLILLLLSPGLASGGKVTEKGTSTVEPCEKEQGKVSDQRGSYRAPSYTQSIANLIRYYGEIQQGQGQERRVLVERPAPIKRLDLGTRPATERQPRQPGREVSRVTGPLGNEVWVQETIHQTSNGQITWGNALGQNPYTCLETGEGNARVRTCYTTPR